MAAAPRTPTFEVRDWAVDPDAHVVVASGEIDLHAAPSLREMLGSLTEQGQLNLVLDMSEATFLDSSAIAALVAHIHNVAPLGGALTVVCANENVLRILQVSGVAQALTIRATVEEALEPDPPPPPPAEEEELTQGCVPQRLELHVAPTASELARVRGFAAAAAFRFGLDPRERHDFTAAANEAVANAIEHGEPCDDETIHVWVTEEDDKLTLGVRDGGSFAFDPPPDDPLPERGRGLVLMSHLVDSLALSRLDGHTHVELSMQRAA
jgi:anti-sigma B factor antagonist